MYADPKSLAASGPGDAYRYGDCKDYLFCFSGLTTKFLFYLPGKPMGITKK